MPILGQFSNNCLKFHNKNLLNKMINDMDKISELNARTNITVLKDYIDTLK